MNEEKDEIKTVSVTELKSDMRISAYIGFGQKYNQMSAATVQWLKHNFPGARSVIQRNDKKLNTTIQDLQEGDSLQKIYQFPPELMKLTSVRPKLISELQKRGFERFEVCVKPASSGKPTIKQAEHRKKVEQAEVFIDNVKESIATREEASFAIEEMMDNTRLGKINIKKLQGMVDEFTQGGSVEAVSAIASLKESDQTYTHCIDVGAIYQMVYMKMAQRKRIKNIFENENEMLMGAFLHDFGKSKVPKDILDSTKRFERDSREMKLMKQHPDFSAQILKKMLMPDYIINMAYYHHVKMDLKLESSYPKIDSYDQLIPESRLMAIIDIYQALVGRRSYKKSWAPAAAVRFIEQLTGIEHDPSIFEEFYQVIGQYPAGSLVELNDGSLAFVISVPEQDLSRPQVVVVRNAQGEDLTRQELLDLQVEKDLSIKKELDHMDVFGEESIEIFSNLRPS